MIERLHLKNFRLFRDAEIEFASGVPTVLIGPNASGKSSVIEALDILSGLMWKTIPEVFQSSGRGGFSRIASSCTGGQFLELRVELASDDASSELTPRFTYDLAFEALPTHTQIVREVLSSTLSDGTPVELLKFDGPGEGRVLKDSPKDSGVDYDQFQQSAQFAAMNDVVGKRYHERANWVKDRFETIVWYPSFAVTQEWAKSGHDSKESPRDSFTPNPSQKLERRGYNLPATLYTMQARHERLYERVMWHWKQEFPFVRDIRFDPMSRLLPMWRHRDFEEPMDWSQMSDGMLSMLCLLAALFQPHEAAIYCFDEPEQHLHPSLIRRFVLAAEEAARELDRRILIVTHSDRLLDFLSDPAKSLRIATSDGNEAKIETIEEDFLEAWLEHYSMSQLRMRGQLDARPNEEL